MLKNILILLTFSLIFSSCKENSPNSAPDFENPLSNFNIKVDKKGLSQLGAVIKTIHGNITIKFFPNEAPHTVTRIMELINQGFYNGLKFHRVIEKFIIQAGDPTESGNGGSGMKLKAEFNELQHIKGTVAMARAEDQDSADSQFYIALNTFPHLDGKYTIFGKVTNGLEILEKIQLGDKIISFSLQAND